MFVAVDASGARIRCGRGSEVDIVGVRVGLGWGVFRLCVDVDRGVFCLIAVCDTVPAHVVDDPA